MDILIRKEEYNPFKLTALKRNKLSSPMQYLLDKGYISKDKYLLDYGCGYGDDIKILNSEYGFKTLGYDKYNSKFKNDLIFKSIFKPDVVTCNYVFNTIHTLLEHKRVVHRLRLLCNDVYISVRKDSNAIRNSWVYDKLNMTYKTNRGSYQRFYNLLMINKLFGKVEIINATSSYILFKLK